MFTLVLAGLGGLIGVASVFLLYLKWRGAVRHPLAVAGGWISVIVSIAVWISALHPDIAVPLAVLVVTVAALVLVLRGADLGALVRYPEPGRRAPDSTGGAPWHGAVARTLSTVVAAPAAGLALGLLTWALATWHGATRFYIAVFVFLISSASVQVWGASARRPWLALGLICVLAGVAITPVILGL